MSHYLHRMLINRDTSNLKEASVKRMMSLVSEKTCPVCKGKRLNQKVLECRVAGYTIYEMCEMEFTKLVEVLGTITDPRAATIVEALITSLNRMIDIGLSYLSLGQPLSTLSGGERQRLKLAKYLDQKGNIYVLDEPTTGLHAADVAKIMELLESLVAKKNTVIVIEHNTDVMKQADYIIDVGPDGGTSGGQIVFTGTVKEMIESAQTITARYLRKDR